MIVCIFVLYSLNQIKAYTMKVKEKGHTLIITSNEATLSEFVEKLEQQYESNLVGANLVIDLITASFVVTEEDIEQFENLAVKHIEEANRSFVIVVESIDFNEFDGDMIIVPTLLEAHDLIEMDEIQRDLGF
ncbi:ribonuclease Z [Myroides pelagicus]|nr:ribonuclease Z [Myroides pelagicus]